LVISFENKHMKKNLIILFVFVIVSVSASAQKKDNKVGADRDKHGCIGSAGYVYSVIKNDCIRVFEASIQLNEVDVKGNSKSIAAIIFSEDKSKAEVFLPGYTNGQILTKESRKYGQSWSNKELILLPKKGFQLFKDKKLIFSLN